MTTTHTTDTLSALRGILYRPHRDTDREVCTLLASAPPGLRSVALHYLEEAGQAPWLKCALEGSEEPMGWELWERLRERCELVPPIICAECTGSGKKRGRAVGGAREAVWLTLRCTVCSGTGVIVPPMLVWRTPLTRGDWPSNSGAWERQAGLPAVNVTWREALMVCNRLSEDLGWGAVYWQESGHTRWPLVDVDHNNPIVQSAPVDDWSKSPGFRLPTVAQWRHFAGEVRECPRCGVDGFGPTESPCLWCMEELDSIAWHAGNSDGRVHPVGQKEPNANGLFDCFGNVWEWCWDGYTLDEIVTSRRIMGGSFRMEAGQFQRETWQNQNNPDNDVGLRPILPLRIL